MGEKKGAGQYIRGKRGLEIGGPCDVFRKGNALPAYEETERVDNWDFSKATVWTKHSEVFIFKFLKGSRRKPLW
jgi:hypothetical protein